MGFALAMLMVLMLVMTACGGGSDTPEVVAPPEAVTEAPVVTEPDVPRSTRLVVALEAEPTSLDPFNTTDGVSTSVQKTMFEGLLKFDQNLQIEPFLAESFSYNDDATQLIFKLRENVYFHDGSKLTADVVKLNYDYVRNSENAMARRSFFSFISDIEVLNDYELIIHSAEPNASMASYLAHPAAGLKSAEVIEMKLANPDYNMDRNPVGTGPFVIGEWRDGQHVIVNAFDNYWDTDNQPQLEAVEFRPVAEASTRVNMLKANEIHFVATLPTGEADQLSTDPDVTVYADPSMNVFYVGMNLQHEKYQDVRVRHAMNHAINKDQLIAQVLDGFGRVADSAIAPSVYGYSRQRIYDYDLEKAKGLLAEAGAEDGFSATLWTRNSTEFVAIAEFVAIQLRALGIDVEVQALESGTLFDALDAGENTDLWIGRWSPGTGEADWGLRPNFASDRVPPNYNNSGFYINEEVDALLNSALANPNTEERLASYRRAQEIIYQEAPWVFLHVVDALSAQRNEVGGIYVSPEGAVNINRAFFK